MKVLTLLLISAKFYVICGQYIQSLNNLYPRYDYNPNKFIQFGQPYYYKHNGKQFLVDPRRQAVLFNNRWYNFQSPKTIHIRDSKGKSRKGHCNLTQFKCNKPFDVRKTSKFECETDFQCPDDYKCCQNKCFVHKICQKSIDEKATTKKTVATTVVPIVPAELSETSTNEESTASTPTTTSETTTSTTETTTSTTETATSTTETTTSTTETSTATTETTTGTTETTPSTTESTTFELTTATESTTYSVSEPITSTTTTETTTTSTDETTTSDYSTSTTTEADEYDEDGEEEDNDTPRSFLLFKSLDNKKEEESKNRVSDIDYNYNFIVNE